MEGRIVKLISNDYTVLSKNKTYNCKSRGKFRQIKITPLVGDMVIFDEENNYILEIKPRKNALNRPPISNVDQALIVVSVKEPLLSLNLLDKMLTVVLFNQIEPIICFTKLDLLDDLTKIDKIISYYQNLGYKVYKNTELTKIKEIFKDKITVIMGQSGAGKSTLINRLMPNLHLKVGEISKALGRGRHTTRHVELIKMYDGFLADTPGFSALTLTDMTTDDIKNQFAEFTRFQDQCEYRDCKHINEQNCSIKKKVQTGEILLSRYENYKKFVDKR